MRLDYFLIGLALFSLVVIGMVSFIGEVNNTYGVSADTAQFSSVYDSINDTYDLSQDIQGHADAQISDTDTADSMFKGSYSAMRLAWSGMGFFIEVINAISTKLGIPSYIIVFGITVLTILIAFSIVYLVLKVLP